MIRNNLSAQQHYDLGVAARKRDSKAEAHEHLRAAANLAPNEARYNGSLGTFLLQQGKADQALAYLQRAVAQAPDHSGYRNNLGTCQSQCHGAPPKDNAQALQAAVREAAVGICERGNTALAAGDLQAATNLFERASLNDPQCARYAYKLAAVLARQERGESALAHFERAAQLQPDNAIFHNGLGTCLYGRGQSGRARWHFERALKLQPANVAYRQNVSLVAVAAEPPRGYTPAAAATHGSAADTAFMAGLRARIAAEPSNAALYSQLGQSLMDAQRLAEALPLLKEARRLAPGVKQYTQQVVRCLAGLQVPASNFAAAEKLFDEERPWAAEPYYLAAIEGEPGYPSWTNALGTALTCLGRYREAAEFLHKAYDLSPDAMYAYNLSVCYHNMGHLGEADKWTRQSKGHVPKSLRRSANDTPLATHASQGLRPSEFQGNPRPSPTDGAHRIPTTGALPRLR